MVILGLFRGVIGGYPADRPAFFVGSVFAAAMAVGCSSPGVALEETLLERELEIAAEVSERGGITGVGVDPFRAVSNAGGRGVLVLLRGSSELVAVTSDGESAARRLETPPSPTAMALISSGIAVVGGELSGTLRFVSTGETPRRIADLVVPGLVSVRDMAFDSSANALYVADAWRDRIVRIRIPQDRDRWLAAGAPAAEAGVSEFEFGVEPIGVKVIGGRLIVNALLSHTISVVPIRGGVPNSDAVRTIVHDGPMWGFDALESGDTLLIAAGGVEDRPLDRTSGEFGHVDSFLFVYRVGVGNSEPARVSEVNTSELGVVTPKAVRFVGGEGRNPGILVAGYGSPDVVELVSDHIDGYSVGRRWEVPPGTGDLAVLENGDIALANPLMDRLVLIDTVSGLNHSVAFGGTSQDESWGYDLRVGELLVYTTLMTPGNVSRLSLSRFTCETCHFEGRMDGRTHFTGRGHVFSTTKPLGGLVNNVPVFTRGGDETLASMTLAEFRAANQGEESEMFSVSIEDFPWLGDVPGVPDVLRPEDLRRAFLTYIASLSRRPNPRRVTHDTLGLETQGGLALFRDRCGLCHQPLFSTRNRFEGPEFAEWNRYLGAGSPDLVWAAPHFSKTGIEPYVSPRGARVPSLRRVTQKYPYFTNGSSVSLRNVLERFRYSRTDAWHQYDGPEAEAESLTPVEIDLLLEALRLF